MEDLFTQFEMNITLTSTQVEDAREKYNNVCNTVHSEYYSAKYDGSTKLLFGSYKLKTNIRPLTESQDVDVLIKLPPEVFDRFNQYQGNGQSALLDEVRRVLKKHFSTTESIKAWGKVILVKFSEGHHNVELLPAFEQEDGTFFIPNSEAGGSWDSFDPRTQLDRFNESNDRTENATRRMVKFAKRWRNNTPSLDLKSFRIQDEVIVYLSFTDHDKSSWELFRGFVAHLKQTVPADQLSLYETALRRLDKAKDLWESGKKRASTEELRKVFGNEFPLQTDDDPDSRTSSARYREINVAPKPWVSHP
jgi:hypothetical protein